MDYISDDMKDLHCVLCGWHYSKEKAAQLGVLQAALEVIRKSYIQCSDGEWSYVCPNCKGEKMMVRF